MITRYDQDLAPFFAKIRAEKQKRSEERRLWLRQGWSSLWSQLRLVGRRS